MLALAFLSVSCGDPEEGSGCHFIGKSRSSLQVVCNYSCSDNTIVTTVGAADYCPSYIDENQYEP